MPSIYTLIKNVARTMAGDPKWFELYLASARRSQLVTEAEVDAIRRELAAEAQPCTMQDALSEQ